MAEEINTLDEQLDNILHPLGVRREAATLDEQLDNILHPLGVRREIIDTADSPEAQANDLLRIHLHFFSFLCEGKHAVLLKERLEQLLRTVPELAADVLQGDSQRGCFFTVVALSPFPPQLLEQLGTWEEIRDTFAFTTALDLLTGGEDSGSISSV